MGTVMINYSTGLAWAAKDPAHRLLPAAGGARSPCKNGGCDEKTALGVGGQGWFWRGEGLWLLGRMTQRHGVQGRSAVSSG